MTFYNSKSLQSTNILSGQKLKNSLRFRRSASAYLSRTPATTGNRKTWTWSGWVKRGKLSSGYYHGLFVSRPTSFSNEQASIHFNNNDAIYIFSRNPSDVVEFTATTNAVFRDPSAWYHILFYLDTTQATAEDRMALYVNGVKQTSFSTVTYPTSQNLDCYLNQNIIHYLGASNGDNYSDGYMTEVNFIDGQALDPTYFGETHPTYGTWRPKRYNGTHGTNGFYLDGSGVTDGSGNGNDWTNNNLNLTTSSATTYDIMDDVPTMSGRDKSNYCTLNPLSPTPNGSSSDGNLKFTGATSWGGSKSTFGIPSTGKWYAEFTLGATSSNSAQADVGVFPDGNSNGYAWSGSSGLEANNGFFLITNGSYSSNRGGTSAAGTVFQIAVDADTGDVWFGVNNAWYDTYNTTNGDPSAGTNPSASSLDFASTLYFMGVKTDFNNWTANFGQQPFAYTPPSGFKKLNAANLPSPKIKDGSKYFNTVLYTGTGTTDQAITGVGFQPDFTWIKSRNNAYAHWLNDAVRGAGKGLRSETTDAEYTTLPIFLSFDTDGFTVDVDDATVNNTTNGSGATFVAWNWKANGSGSSNTDGSITSTVSANTTSGFSVVTYTGTGTSGDTIGHGLGVAPSFVIFKNRSAAQNWLVQGDVIGDPTTGAFLLLETTAAKASNNTVNTTFSSSTITLDTSATYNGSGNNHVAYCFAPVKGFSAFGSYTGNGSTDGPFIYTGFRPAFVIVKASSTAGYSWNIIDTARDTYNTQGLYLFANTTGTEGSGSYVDVLSNGFKLRNLGAGVNGSGITYIYMAFAENPFKYSNAR